MVSPAHSRWRRPPATLTAALALVALLSLHAPEAEAQNTAARASQFYEDALQRFNRKDFAGAVVQLKNVLKLDAQNLPAQLLLARALLTEGQPGAAEVALNEALRLGVNRTELVMLLARALVAQGKQRQLLEDPRLSLDGLAAAQKSALLLMRASAYADIGDGRGALRTIDEARALDGKSAEPWIAEVPVRIRSGQLAEALAAADRAVQMAPGSGDAQYGRGSVMHAKGDLQGALAAYDKALQAMPSHQDALVTRAGLLVDLGRPTDARRDIEVLRKEAPKDPRGAYLKALLDERDGNAAAAKAALQEVTNLLDPVPLEFLRFRPQVLMLGGLAHHGLNQMAKAKPYLEAMQRLQASSPVAKLLAQIYLSEGNVDRAIESLDLYLRGQPNDGQALLLLASAHASQGRHNRAAQLMGDALKARESPEMRTLLGLSLLGTGKVVDAVRELELAFARAPDQVQAGSALVLLYLQSNQESKAAAAAQKLAQQRPKDAGVQNLLGMALAAKRDTPGARAAFETALKLDPKFFSPHVQLARLEARAGRADAAVAHLNTVLKADDKNLDALMEYAALLEQRQKLAEAALTLTKAADLSTGNHLQPALSLVDFHLRHGQPKAAQQAVDRLAAKAPGSVQVLLALARVSLANGEPDAAKSSLLRASRAADYQPPVLLQIAALQVQAGAIAEAAHALNKALGERPDFLPAQALLSEVELRLGDAAKAESRARQIVAKHPKEAVGHALLGDVARSRGQNAAALEHYRRAHQIERSTSSLLRVFALLTPSDTKASVALLEGWVRQRPNDAAARSALGDTLARTGQLGPARSHYETALKSTPDNAEILNNLAQVLILQKDPGAAAVAERALALAPTRPHVLGTAGWAAYSAGQTDRALQLLRDARLRDPNNPDTRYFLGAVLAKQGRSPEAREELRAALALSREFVHAADTERLLATLN